MIGVAIGLTVAVAVVRTRILGGLLLEIHLEVFQGILKPISVRVRAGVGVVVLRVLLLNVADVYLYGTLEPVRLGIVGSGSGIAVPVAGPVTIPVSVAIAVTIAVAVSGAVVVIIVAIVIGRVIGGRCCCGPVMLVN